MKEAYWFPHDCNAHRDPKIIMLRSIYGYEALGIYWSIVEILRDQSDYSFDVGGKFGYQTLAALLGLDRAKVEELVSDMVTEFELLELKNNKITSPSLIRRMAPYDARKKNGKKGGRPKAQKNLDKTETKPRPKPRNNLDHNLEITGTETRRGEESILTNRRVEGRPLSSTFQVPRIEVVKSVAEEWATNHKKDKQEATQISVKFYGTYQGLGWKTKGGQSIMDWRALLIYKWLIPDCKKKAPEDLDALALKSWRAIIEKYDWPDNYRTAEARDRFLSIAKKSKMWRNPKHEIWINFETAEQQFTLEGIPCETN